METAEDIKNALNTIHEEMELHVDYDDVDGLIEKGMRLSALIPTSNIALARSKELLNIRKAEIIKLNMNDFQPSILIKIAEGEAASEDALYTEADRINKMLVHSLDFLRSAISMRKAELENHKMAV